jgi:hypothetical protein
MGDYARIFILIISSAFRFGLAIAFVMNSQLNRFCYGQLGHGTIRGLSGKENVGP